MGGANPSFCKPAAKSDWVKVSAEGLLRDGDLLRLPEAVNLLVTIKGFGRQINYGKVIAPKPHCIYGERCKKLENDEHLSKYAHGEK
jgi:hypothetical protein